MSRLFERKQTVLQSVPDYRLPLGEEPIAPSGHQFAVLLLIQSEPRAAPANADAVLQSILVVEQLGSKPLTHNPDLDWGANCELSWEGRLAISLKE